MKDDLEARDDVPSIQYLILVQGKKNRIKTRIDINVLVRNDIII